MKICRRLPVRCPPSWTEVAVRLSPPLLPLIPLETVVSFHLFVTETLMVMAMVIVVVLVLELLLLLLLVLVLVLVPLLGRTE